MKEIKASNENYKKKINSKIEYINNVLKLYFKETKKNKLVV